MNKEAMDQAAVLQLTLDHFKSNLANLKLSINFHKYERQQLANVVDYFDGYYNNNLKQQVESHEKLLARSKGAVSTSNTLLQGYNEQMDWLKRAVKNLDEKIELLEKELADKEESGGKIMDLLMSLQNIDNEHLDRDDDTMEIKEELDDDDNVIRSSVEPYRPQSNEEGLPFENIQEPLSDEDETEQPAQFAKPVRAVIEEPIDDDVGAEDQIEELLRDMEITPSVEQLEDTPKVEQLEEPSGKEEKTELSPNVIEAFHNAGLDPQDALELELFMDDEDYDHDFDDFDIEPDDGYWHGGDSETIQMRIEQELMKQEARDSKQPNRTAEPSKPILKTKSASKEQARLKKSVSFNETLDIKNVENISSEYYNGNGASMTTIMQNWLSSKDDDDDDDDDDGDDESEEDVEDVEEIVSPVTPLKISRPEEPEGEEEPQEIKPKVSRFKQARQGNVASTITIEDGPAVGDIVERPITDAVEHPLSDIVERPVSDIIERPVSNIAEPLVLNKVEEPQQRKLKVDLKSLTPRTTKSQGTPIPVPRDEIEIHELHELKSEEEHKKENEHDENEEQMQMIRDYASGVFDDDVPNDHELVIEKLDDFARHNLIVEQSGGAKVEEILDDEPEDADVMETEIVEHFGSDGDEEDDIEASIMMQQVANSYQSLRKKIVLSNGGYKETEEELEREPIDEFGNPIKVSRFKAALLSKKSI